MFVFAELCLASIRFHKYSYAKLFFYVAMKLYIPVPFNGQTVYYLELLKTGQAKLLAPELIIAELGDALWKKELNSELRRGEAQLFGETMANLFPAELTDVR